ncbi:DUF362 domain-containing protein [bacterium]|nr:DUF362 domain-containing protein [bacterium]
MLSRKIGKGRAVCPETDQSIEQKRRHRWLVWAFPLWGVLALIWFLIRVIPKPSRATYPCQRIAAPIASSFIAWIAGLAASAVAYCKGRRLLRESRYALAAICATAAVMAIWWASTMTAERPAEAAFTPTDSPNAPIGEGKGIYPGRVVWVHDPAATVWDGANGSWWDDDNTDQSVVDRMIAKAIRSLTAQPSDGSAWDALFHHFNQANGFGDVGYQSGERIAIKVNMNQDSGGAWGSGAGMPSPHVIYSLLDQLINVAGVPGSAITLYDGSRYIGDPIYNKVRSNPDADFQAVRFVVKPSEARSGRIAATRDMSNTVYFGSKSVPNNGTTNLPRCVTEAKYLINMALLRAHSLFGVTLCAKNHFGSVYSPSAGNWTPSPLHDSGSRSNPMASYNCLVDLTGQKHLGGKTLLYIVDGLYSARNQGANVIRFRSFGDDWCSSVFLSQDPVAIDSVALDFLRNEPNCTDVTGNPDNYLHEAAQANDPPSGTFYDPEGDGTRLASLGVHEHWNNANDKQYSRNLGTGEGIELIAVEGADPTELLVEAVQLNRKGHVGLSWSHLGSNFVYSVEFADSLAEGGWDLVPPVEQWPTSATSWTDTSVSGTVRRFYRIRTEAVQNPASAAIGE